MSSSEPSIYCINPACANPRNAVGGQVCASCQTPIVYRYLWAVGQKAAEIQGGEVIGDRYSVVAPQVWLDTKPAQSPSVLPELPDELLPYLRLYPHRLHVPEVYGFCQIGDPPNLSNILLLENVPIDAVGNLYSSLSEAWPNASAARQVYWLWQILQLWQPLLELGVADSLLVADNIRVEGWRVWLLELYADEPPQARSKAKSQTRLQDLANHWLSWISGAQTAVAEPLNEICQQMLYAQTTLEAIAEQLNRLLLEQTARLPLRVRIAGGSDTGPARSHNEDTCYPTTADIKAQNVPPNDQLIPYFAIVCDGVGGHDGGEVASQSAVNSLKPLIQTLLAEVADPSEIATPEVVIQQLEESIRVINNTIAAQNDTQGRESRQRMGTTLVMALQLPQQIPTADGTVLANAHELYIANVGDSRAYWIADDHCQRLSIDDDVATREVRLGRCLYREALQRGDAGALTQALGTRDGEFISPNVRRFIIEEDGLLLLCSDGLSDNDWVELTWANYAPAVLNGDMSLDEAVQTLINLANEKNGHDNTSVILVHYRLSPEPLVLFNPKQVNSEMETVEFEFSQTAKALLDETSANTQTKPTQRQEGNVLGWSLVLGAIAALAGGAIAWQMRDNLPKFWQTPTPIPEPTTPSASPSLVPESPAPESPAPATESPTEEENVQ